MKRSHSSFTERAANVGPQQRKHQVLGVDYPQTLPSCSGFSTCQEQQPLLHGQPGCLIVSTSRDTSTRWPQGNGGPTYSSVAARGAPIAPLAARTQNTSSGLAQQAGSERLHRTSQIPVLTTCSGLDQSRRKNAVELSMADPSVRSVLPSAQQQQNQQSEQCSAHMYPAAALQLAQRRSQPHLPQQASHVRPSSEGCISRSLEPPLQRQQAPPGLALAQQTDSTRPARASADSAAYVSFLAPGHMTSSLAPAPVASAADLRDQTTNRPAAGFELLPQASNTAADAPSVKPSIGTWAAHSSNSTLVDPIVHIMQNGTGENVHTDSRLDTYTVGSKSATFHSGTGSWPNGDLGQANARAGRQSLPACSGTAPVGPICSEPHDLSCKLTVIQDPPLHYQFHPPRAPQCPAKEHQRPQPQQDRHQVQPVQPRERPFPQQPPQPWQPPAPPPQHLQQQQSNVLSQEKPQQEGCNQRQQPQSNPQQQQQQHHAPPLTLAAQSQAASAITVAAESAPQLSFSSGAQRRLTALPEAAAANGEACNSQEAHAASSLLAFRSGSRDGQRGNGIVESAQPSPSNVMPPAEKLKRPLRMEPSEWIPHAGIVAAFASKGVTKLYPWQAAALECGEDGHNLVYCAPTSGGKSLVAEILMIRRLLAAARARQRQLFNAPQAAATSLFPRALLVLPYVSIVSEKAEHLKRVLAPLRGKVCGYSGMEHTGAPLSAPDEMVAVVTMEKANSTVNRMMAEGRLGELCCVVVDEAHMVGDPHR
ncbi:hypothetical protein Vretifemale_6223 [Volvox reticuliferus]|nr:hypothetical protein Vretifemale_6223 [Volvox reticuliferus]